ncbi:cyclic GMP-AMP synthase-like [Ranitomeya variabilis]|uniref:cyclic GMP-AMP synthase-like n=1 Tax=Ranitomeya variabilis TaxID=490064 RepID=UPI0040579EBA
MDGRRQSDQHKEMATRPKEPRSRGGSARSSVQSGNAAKMKRDSEKPEKYPSSKVDNRGDGHSGGRKTLQKSPTEERRKNDPTEESNHPTIKSTRKQRDTPAKKEKDRETSPEGSNMTDQLTDDVKNFPKEYNGFSEITQNRARDKASKPLDRPQKLRDAKCKSLDEICENGQVKVASGKKGCDKRSKEEKNDVSILDKGNTEPKGNDLKTASSRTPRRMKDLVNGKLRMKMEDISKAAEKVNKVVSTILKSREFQGDPLFKDINKLSTGSYYERVKISKPNEFDIMLEISVPSYNTILLTNLDKKGPFYTLAFKGRSPPAMEEYIEEGNISANEIMKKFRGLIKQIIGKAEMEDVTLQRKDPGSPAVTISIRNEPQDISVDLVVALKIINRLPKETKGGMKIDDWLGMKVKLEYKRSHFYMVPKRAMMGNRTLNADTWRISFSNIEKEILSNHGNGKTCCESGGSKKEMCCRKQCLKLLKFLLELLKENGKQRKMDQFCSYHAKTALLHLCATYPKDDDWKLEDLESCFDRYVSFFQDCLKNYTLDNFFLPSHNLFSAESVDKSNCDYLYREIEKQQTHDYPIFND